MEQNRSDLGERQIGMVHGPSDCDSKVLMLESPQRDEACD